MSQGLQRLNDATERQEAPRVALGECQGYYRLAVTSARKKRREREGYRKWEEEDQR